MTPQNWSIVQYVLPHESPTDVHLGLLADDLVREAPAEFSGLGVMDLVERWDTFAPTLQSLETTKLQGIQDAHLIAPLTYPRKVLCAGANYYSHASEMGTQQPDPEGEPFFFLKPPTTTVVGPQAAITLPEGSSDVDWEAELAVVIGRHGRNVAEEDAPSYVAGYAVANDLSARGLFPRKDAVFPPFGWDWLKHKGFDGFCPLGPGIVPSWQIEDPHELKMRLSVNGEIKQDNSTADMVITIPRLIAAASRIVTLEPGDVILTGTPAGVGMPQQTFLHDGDVVVTEIDGIGRLENRMVKA